MNLMPGVKDIFIGCTVGLPNEYSALAMIQRYFRAPVQGEVVTVDGRVPVYLCSEMFRAITTYQQLSDLVTSIVMRPLISGRSPKVLINDQGEGSHTTDIMRRSVRSLPVGKVIGVRVRGGTVVSETGSSDLIIPKADLVNIIIQLAQVEQLKIAGEGEKSPGEKERAEFRKQLENMKITLKRKKELTADEFFQEEQQDEDLLLALGICLWYAEVKRPARAKPRRSYIEPAHDPFA